MLDVKTLDDFTKKVNKAHQQFCVWMYTNNEFVKYQKIWNLNPFLLYREPKSN